MPIRFPDKSLTIRIIVRACVVWLALRVVSLGAPWALGWQLPGGFFSINLYATILVIVVTTALVTLDGRRRNEHMFMANLGVSLPALVVLAATLPTVLEIALSLAVRLW